MNVTMVPLDERPVNVKYPQMLAAVSGINLTVPPDALMGRLRTPCDVGALHDWLEGKTETTDAFIVSIETFAYGSLINSRVSNECSIDIISRLPLLATLNRSAPVHAFSIVTRVSNADDCVEEPLYWKNWGTQCYRFGNLWHRESLGRLGDNLGEAEALRIVTSAIPDEVKQDWLLRRLRNHTVALALQDMTARGLLESLLITSDDTSAYGLPSRERDWLQGWSALIGATLSSRLSMHPGADEVGSALVSKLVSGTQSTKPKIFVVWSNEDESHLVAPYEDRPLRDTVFAQVEACGGEYCETHEGAALILGVVTPSRRLCDYRPEFLIEDRTNRAPDYVSFLERLVALSQADTPLAIADVAYPNGADPTFMELFFQCDALLRSGSLCAFGAWNTAGNTLGTTIAQAICSLHIGDSMERRNAQDLFLAHRFLEDFGYQSVVRRQARDFCVKMWGTRDPDPQSEDQLQQVRTLVEELLGIELSKLQGLGIAQRITLKLKSVCFPWDRLFEVDFELVRSVNK